MAIGVIRFGRLSHLADGGGIEENRIFLGRSETRLRLSWDQVGSVAVVEEYLKFHSNLQRSRADRAKDEVPDRYIVVSLLSKTADASRCRR
jgi:hypothetical protein